MKKILLFALVILAGYYAWQRAPEILKRPPVHQLVVTNDSIKDIERLRVKVGSQTFVKELLKSGEDVTFPLRVHRDELLEMTWRWSDSNFEDHWGGGHVNHGPIAQRHLLTIMEAGSVIHRVERRLGK